MKVLLLTLGVMMGALMPSNVALAVENETEANAASSSCDKEFLGLRPWYYGLEKNADCTILSPTTCKPNETCSEEAISSGLTKFIWTIVLNILVDLFVIAGVVAVGFLIYGGYLYLRSGGDPAFAAKGRKTITASLVGLAIVVLANVISKTITAVLTEARGQGTEAISSILNWAYAMMGLVAVIGIIFGAVVWTTSQGDPAKVKKGRDAIIYAVIGLGVVLLAVAITNLIVGAANQ